MNFALSICILFAQLVFADGAPVQVGKIASSQGRVLIRNESLDKKDKTAPTKIASPGVVLVVGDVINTSSDGSAKLLMSDQTILDVGPSSLFKIDQWHPNQGSNRQVAMTLGYGKLRALVNQKVSGNGQFKLKTPSATMGVRGTEFVVQAGDAGEQVSPARGPNRPGAPVAEATPRRAVETQITVLHGEVAVSRPQETRAPPISVTEGKQLTTQAVLTPTGQVAAANRAEPPPTVIALPPVALESARASATVVDNTFAQSVNLDMGSGGERSGGSETLAFVSQMVSGPSMISPPSVNMGDLGFNGGFSGNSGLGGAAYYPGVIGTSATVRVTFSR